MRSSLPDLPGVCQVIRQALGDVAAEIDRDLLHVDEVERRVLDLVPEIGLVPTLLRCQVRRAAQEMRLTIVEE